MTAGQAYSTDRIRNVVFLGHGGCGKTTLIDALCFVTGTSKRRGNVRDGTAITMYAPEEIGHGISIQTAIAHAEWADTKINLLDTPGYLDFTGDALAATRACLSTALRQEDFDVAIPLAERFTDGVAASIERHGLPWHVQRLGCRAEYWFCPPPRDGATAAAAVDEELDGFMHLWALNRGILLAPFHNMSLFSPFHTEADVGAHTAAFRGAVEALIG